MSELVTSEEPVLLGKDQRLFGVLTRSDETPAEIGVIILNAGLLHNVGPFRLHVDLARALAQEGIASIRLDQSGKGESPARQGMTRPESMLADYDDSMAKLATIGVKKAILCGLCSGADDSTVIAEQRDSVTGLVLLDGYARRNWRFRLVRLKRHLSKAGNLGKLRRAISRRIAARNHESRSDSAVDKPSIDIRDWPRHESMKNRIAELLRRQGKILAVFTSGQDYYNHVGQFAATCGLPERRDQITELYFADSDHTYSDPQQRRGLIEAIVDWMSKYSI